MIQDLELSEREMKKRAIKFIKKIKNVEDIVVMTDKGAMGCCDGASMLAMTSCMFEQFIKEGLLNIDCFDIMKASILEFNNELQPQKKKRGRPRKEK